MTNFALRSTDDTHIESSMVLTGPGFITQSGIPTDEQFEFIRSNFGDPRANVKPSDYYAFRMIASGDGLDSYYTRQDVATSFANFVRDLRKGQSVLGHHQADSFTYGSSFAGEIIPADETRPEYESTFYPQWDSPELRTKQWLVGDYYITRGVTLNNQSADDLVRSMELGGVRKASISFMVGQYVCGLDGIDLISTMFGPMPDESCTHFPGVAYDGQIAWALMKNNTLVETSLVYKNASPSSMLLRKAETLAERGVLSVKDINTLENRFQVRLPRFERRVYPVVQPNGTTAGNVEIFVPSNVAWTSNTGSDTSSTTVHGMEDIDMATRRSGANATARELAREALVTELEPEQDETVEATSEATEEVAEQVTAESLVTESSDGDTTTRDAVADDDGETADAVSEVVDEASGDSETTTEEASESDVTEAASDDEAARAVEGEERHKGHAHGGESKGGHKKTTGDDTEANDTDGGDTDGGDTTATSESAVKEEVESKTESTREENAIAAFVEAADQLASALARKPDAFDSGQLSVAARAERAVDLALIDAGCDTTVGGHVARTFETRSKTLREVLGEPLTVEAIRNLQSKATLGETLYEELVKDAVAARTGAQGESFNAPKYRDLLMAARDVAYVKEEIESWKDAKKDRFTPGRSVVPRRISDARPSKDERKTLPEAPSSLTASKAGNGGSSMSIFEPRKK